MQVTGGKLLLVLAVGLALTACDRTSEPRLLNTVSSTQGPDEFAILPNKPLEQPENFTDLPPPRPGGRNRVDATPVEDAVAALGGRPSALNAGGIPSSDAGLVRAASRYGVERGIRQQLAAEDLAFRRRNDGRILERLFNVNVYFRAYERQSLDKYAELERFRRLGVRTPAAPPASQTLE
ncbi:MAG: DUF3035 domain-containing protein [Rhodobacter sp.]|nr:DUF3035 domain-containing protein [Rhodobacter sp.]